MSISTHQILSLIITAGNNFKSEQESFDHWMKNIRGYGSTVCDEENIRRKILELRLELLLLLCKKAEAIIDLP